MILEIVSPEATLFSGEVTSVSVPALNVDFPMFNNHAAVVSILQKGNVKISAASFNIDKNNEAKFTKVNEQTYWLAIQSGTIEMNNNKVIVLAD